MMISGWNVIGILGRAAFRILGTPPYNHYYVCIHNSITYDLTNSREMHVCIIL